MVVDILRKEFRLIRSVYVSGSSEPSLVWLAVRSGDDRRVRHRLLQHLALARRAKKEFIGKYEFVYVTDFVTMAYDTLPHDWSYQGEVMRKKPLVLGKNLPTWWEGTI